ncbi:unnamed protein product [Chondrus crispus]|uniref:Uncharacterized protein n=1 Tax=Chondrus crispus TaxID=2769 RepID=R7QQL6_CHOCR|nr:unnamed protein product [Chondrus crispus]CDF39680.1 unnamed protein product [Chondrus crispus]|eukprot:XP_005709974.1 unnamed protein product [Chondrus crispus]
MKAAMTHVSHDWTREEEVVQLLCCGHDAIGHLEMWTATHPWPSAPYAHSTTERPRQRASSHPRAQHPPPPHLRSQILPRVLGIDLLSK